VLRAPEPGPADGGRRLVPDLREVKGQESAKRALEIAAAGGHNLLFIGPPGSGKSMMAQRLPGLLPPLTPAGAAGDLDGLVGGRLIAARRADPRPAVPRAASFRLHGGPDRRRIAGQAGRGVAGPQRRAVPGRTAGISAQALDSLRQPLETGEIGGGAGQRPCPLSGAVPAGGGHEPLPLRPGRGRAAGPAARRPTLPGDYQNRISGPMFDRIDLTVETPPVTAADMALPPPAEGTAEAAARVAAARQIQRERFAGTSVRTNAQAEGELLDKIAKLDAAGSSLLTEAAERMKLSARGYHRVLKVARTIADLTGSTGITKAHIAEALSYRRLTHLI
jgi:magnesium chelatase family protein